MKNTLDNLFEEIIFENDRENSSEKIYQSVKYKQEEKEYRKLLDKIAIQLIINNFENSLFVQAMLKLTRTERIVLTFNVIMGMSISEVSFLVGININNISVQKHLAINHIKKIIIEENLIWLSAILPFIKYWTLKIKWWHTAKCAEQDKTVWQTAFCDDA